MATRWGIAGAGKICHDFTSAVLHLPKGEHQVVAVGVSNLQRAQEFADRHGIPKAYGSYKELSTDPDVDVVYVGVITSLHLDVSKVMLENGKHVLCEKALTVNLKEAKLLTNLAKEKNLFLMEAVWCRCFPVYGKIKSVLEEGLIGDIKHMNCTFGLDFEESERVGKKKHAGGSLLDLGTYGIQLATLIFQQQMPVEVKAVGLLNDKGVDIALSACMKFPNGGMATVSTSVATKYFCEAFIVGSKGKIKIEYPFWCPTKMTVNDKVFEFKLPDADYQLNYINGQGLQYEAAEVRRCLQQGLKESPLMTTAETELTMSILDWIRNEAGVTCDTNT